MKLDNIHEFNKLIAVLNLLKNTDDAANNDDKDSSSTSADELTRVIALAQRLFCNLEIFYKDFIKATNTDESSTFLYQKKFSREFVTVLTSPNGLRLFNGSILDNVTVENNDQKNLAIALVLCSDKFKTLYSKALPTCLNSEVIIDAVKALCSKLIKTQYGEFISANENFMSLRKTKKPTEITISVGSAVSTKSGEMSIMLPKNEEINPSAFECAQRLMGMFK